MLPQIKGELKLVIWDPDQARISVRTSGVPAKSEGFVCRLHPKIDKASWDQGGLLLRKDAAQPYPVGSDNAPVILKWRKVRFCHKSTFGLRLTSWCESWQVTSDDDQLPFSVNFWPNSENGRSVVSAELTHTKMGVTFRNIYVTIKCKYASFAWFMPLAEQH